MSEDRKIHEGEKPAPSKGNAFDPSVDADRGGERSGAAGGRDSKIDAAIGEKDDSPPQNKHGVLTMQTTPKEPDETRVSATDEGHKDKAR